MTNEEKDTLLTDYGMVLILASSVPTNEVAIDNLSEKYQTLLRLAWNNYRDVVINMSEEIIRDIEQKILELKDE